ncbi:hypothetical protein B0H15DRAFT_887156 [Mycena belliarum]|uniref:Protein kinase domain-containing protein n=1 Tax=Mycena belliarum TaxID=1033014 RepID=A0AAD6U3Z3_9AGAR|nr:hypothetical protein B0H15DRAFT_887156 [Mycena belliae]
MATSKQDSLSSSASVAAQSPSPLSLSLKPDAASTAAKIPNMLETQKTSCPLALYHGRPAHLSGLDVTLLHPVFSEFQASIRRDLDTFPFEQNDLALTDDYLLQMSSYLSEEPDRQIATAPLMAHFFGDSAAMRTELASNSQRYMPDGVLIAHLLELYPAREHGRYKGKTLFREMENGVGSGGVDPVDQGLQDYQLHCQDNAITRLHQASYVPAFLLAEAAPNFVIYGLCYEQGHVVAQPLTECVSVIPRAGVPGDMQSIVYTPDECHLASITRCFRSLANSLQALRLYYQTLKPASPQPDLLQPSPHFTTFNAGGNTHTLVYHEQLACNRASPQRAVFRATVDSAGASRMCVVKFAKSYNSEAHRSMTALGHAPRLLHCQREPSVGNFYVVIAEFISEITNPQPQQYESLQPALVQFHAQGFVYGELRLPNVLVDEAGCPKLVDFDWSGKAGSVRYPRLLNMELHWPPGVAPMAQITAEHDMWMLAHLPQVSPAVDTES